jgi:hypothetical protein
VGVCEGGRLPYPAEVPAFKMNHGRIAADAKGMKANG